MIVSKVAPPPRTFGTVIIGIYAVKYAPVPHSFASEVALVAMAEHHAEIAIRESKHAVTYIYMRVRVKVQALI